MLRQVNIFLISKILTNTIIQNVSRYFHLVYSCVIGILPQILYECNFDKPTTSNDCFTSTLLVVFSLGDIGNSAPVSPLSDVTSISEINYN